MIEVVGLHLSQIRRLPRLYPRNEQLKSYMVEIYQIIFEFCGSARGVFVQAGEKNGLNSLRAKIPVGLSSMVKLVWKPFKVQFEDIKIKLGDCMTKINDEISLAEKEEAHEERVRQAKDRIVQANRWEETEHFHKKWQNVSEDASMEKVTKWLAPADVLSNHNASVKLRYGSTGSWFLKGNEFQSWLEDDESPIFWLHATPGAGKTVLASSIINYFKHDYQNDEVGLAYFYCDYKDHTKQEPSVVLRTLLSQLSSQNISVFQRVQSFYREQCKDDRGANLAPPSLDLIRSNFSAFLTSSFHKVYIVIDAIDECNERECILKAITALGDTIENVKILVTSREESVIFDELKEFPNFKIRPMHVSDDIEDYIRATVSDQIAKRKLKVRNPVLQQQILEVLVSKAEGMYGTIQPYV
jgi:hypothetical protein